MTGRMAKPRSNKPQPASPHSHDHLVKLYLGEANLFADFLLNYGDPALVSRLNLAKLHREPTVAVTGKLTERLSDLRYRCEFRGSRLPLEAFIFLEHQSASHPYIPLRILQYIFDAYHNFLSKGNKGKSPRLLPYPLAIVLYHGKMPWRGPLTMRELIGVPEGVNKFILDYPLILVDASRMDPTRLRGSLVLQALLAALGANAQDDFEQRFPMIMENLAASGNDPLLRDRMDAMTYYAMNRCQTRTGYQVVNAAYERAFGVKDGSKMAKTLLEQLLDQGRAEGMEKGMEKGTEIIAVKILASRFGEIPASLEKRIERMTDLEDLQRLAVLAATCESLAEFKRAATEIKAVSKK